MSIQSPNRLNFKDKSMVKTSNLSCGFVRDRLRECLLKCLEQGGGTALVGSDEVSIWISCDLKS